MMARGISHYLRLLQWGLHHYLPEHDVAIETANGRLACSSRDWLIGKHLFVRRDYEIELIESTVAFLRDEGLLSEGRNNTLLDVGANLGMISIAMLRRDYFDRAIAFEPEPRNFRLLQKNAGQNGLSDRLESFEYALSSKNGDVEFEVDETNSGDSRVRVVTDSGPMGEQDRRTFQVSARTLDNFMSEHAIEEQAIDLVWIDVQGHEGHFFQGGKGFLGRNKVPVVSEFWGYGIDRSGISVEEYCDTVKRTFSSFFQFDSGEFIERPIVEIRSLFAQYSKPREIANLIFV